jgi:4-carboxymuconolactone decarboxylase
MSMKRGRLDWYHPAELNPDQLSLYEQITGRFSGASRPTPLTDPEGRLEGPFNVMLTSPSLGAALNGVGNTLRFPGTLPRAVFETIVLVVGAERAAEYEWYAHRPLAERAGVEQAAIAAVRRGDYEAALTGPLAALVRATLDHKQPPAEAVAAVEADYGVAGVTEVVAAVAYYDLIAALLRTWDIPLPEGAVREFG